MPNPYFEFKQFKVYHDKCAMKVGTDGVLLGAWTNIRDVKSVLDVGTGSGLISLMLAQRLSSDLLVNIDAIDIDSSAVLQAIDNIRLSPFDYIKCIHSSLQDFVQTNQKKYDLIVSNPPFFISSLKSSNIQRSLARHTDSLSIECLISLSAKMLSDNGRISLIYPYSEKNKLIDIAKQEHLSVTHLTNIYPRAESKPKRVLIELSKSQVLRNVDEDNLTIETERHVYTNEFVDLVKDFYLKL